MPRGDRAGSQSDRLRDRQPEREERGKRGACIDPSGYDAGKKIKGIKRRVSRTHRRVRRCGAVRRDEGRPLESGSQVQASNRCKLRTSRAVVVSVAEKPGLDFGRMIWRGARERTIDEVSKRPNRCRNRAWSLPPGQAREQTWKLPARHPAFRRREARSGSCMERENLSSRCKGRRPSGEIREDQSTDAGHRDGVVCSREEGSVMGLDRKRCTPSTLLGSGGV